MAGPADAQGVEDVDAYGHFWFLANLAECGGEPCALVSPVFELTARVPGDSVLHAFRARATERFHGVAPQPLVEPLGSPWRDEVEAVRAERIDAWRRMGWTVYVIDMPDGETPDSLLFARADAVAKALADGYRAEAEGHLAVALMWYRRAAALSDGGDAAAAAIARVEAQVRRMARSLSGDSGTGW
jgi:hypothetical protein